MRSKTKPHKYREAFYHTISVIDTKTKIIKDTDFCNCIISKPALVATNNVCACSVASVMSDSATPWTVAPPPPPHPTPLSMGFSRQDYWCGLPCPPAGDLRNPVIESASPALQADSLPTEPPGKSLTKHIHSDPSFPPQRKWIERRMCLSRFQVSHMPCVQLYQKNFT